MFKVDILRCGAAEFRGTQACKEQDINGVAVVGISFHAGSLPASVQTSVGEQKSKRPKSRFAPQPLSFHLSIRSTSVSRSCSGYAQNAQPGRYFDFRRETYYFKVDTCFYKKV